MEYVSANKKLIVLFFIILVTIPLSFYLLKNIGKSKPGSCLVLEEKYCHRGTILYYNDKPMAVGFSLPKNTPVFAPFEGNINSSTMGVTKDNKSFSYPSLNLATGIYGDHAWEVERALNAVFYYDQQQGISKSVVKNQIIGTLTMQTIDFFGPYNFIVYFSVPNENKLFTVDREFTFKLFGL